MELVTLPPPTKPPAEYPSIPARTRTCGTEDTLPRYPSVDDVVLLRDQVADIIGSLKEIEAITDTLKEAVELLTGTRANGQLRAVTPTQIESVLGIENMDNAINDPNWNLIDDASATLEQIRQEIQDAQQDLLDQVAELLALEAGIRADADGIINVKISDQTVQVNNNTASIVTQSIARATADEALAVRLETVSAVAGGNAAAITNESVVRANGDEALAVQIDAVTAVTNFAGRVIVSATPPTHANPPANTIPLVKGDMWIDTAHKHQIMIWDGAAWIPRNHTDIAANVAAIVNEQTARATADSAMAQDVTNVLAIANGNTANVTTEAAVRANADTAFSQQMVAVNAGVGNATAGGLYRVTAVVDTTSGLTSAEFAIQVRASDSVTYSNAGMRIRAAAGAPSYVLFNANQFIVNTGDGIAPFVIEGNEISWGGILRVDSVITKNMTANSVSDSDIEVLPSNFDRPLDGQPPTPGVFNTFMTASIAVRGASNSVINMFIMPDFQMSMTIAGTIRWRIVFPLTGATLFEEVHSGPWNGLSSPVQMRNAPIFFQYRLPVNSSGMVTQTITVQAQVTSTIAVAHTHRVHGGARLFVLVMKR